LISKKKITTPYGPEAKKTDNGLPGLTVVAITSIEEFEDALILCLLNGKIK
jgi:hypothetical protein